MKLFNFKKLATSFILPVVIVATIILVFFQILNITHEYEQSEFELNEKGNSVVQLLETASKNPLWDYSIENIKQIGDAIANDEEIAIVTFYDAKYNLIYMIDKGEENPAYVDELLINYPRELNGTIFAKEVKLDDETAGYIELALTKYYKQENIDAYFNTSIIQNIIILFLLSILITIVTKFLVGRINVLARTTEVIASGDLTSRIDIDSRDEIGDLADKFNDMTVNLYNLVSKFNNVAHTLAASSEEMAASVDDSIDIVKDISTNTEGIVTSTKNQAEDIEKIDNSVNNMSNYFQEIAINVDEVTAVSNESIRFAIEGENAVKDTIKTVMKINTIVEDAESIINGLAVKSQEINFLADAINEITDKTKMLSLNASIEAARSGEAGKGFAVVADEIKKLADQSNEITIKITDSVANIQTAIKEAVTHMGTAPKAVADGNVMVQKTVEALEKIMISTEKTATKLGEIKESTHLQIVQSKEVASSVSNITSNSKASVSESEIILSRVIQQEKVVEEISGAATDLAKLAEELIDVSNSFKI